MLGLNCILQSLFGLKWVNWAERGLASNAKCPFTRQSTGNQLKERDFTFPKCDLLPHWPIVPLLGCANTLPNSLISEKKL